MPEEESPQKDDILFTFKLFGYKMNVTAAAVCSGIFSAILSYYSAQQEAEAREKQTKSIIDAIEGIKSFILEIKIEDLGSELETLRKLLLESEKNDLQWINNIYISCYKVLDRLKVEIKPDDYYSNFEIFPIYSTSLSLLLSISLLRKKLYGIDVDNQMINEIDEYLKLADQSERYCYSFLRTELGIEIYVKKYPFGYNPRGYAVANWYKNFWINCLSQYSTQEHLKHRIQIRSEIEQTRRLLSINLNGSMELDNPEYGGFNMIDRCREIKIYDDCSFAEGRTDYDDCKKLNPFNDKAFQGSKYMALNSPSDAYGLSIGKDTKNFLKETEINFTVALKTREPSSMKAELIIWELGVDGTIQKQPETFTLISITPEWQLHHTSLSKRSSDSVVRCEIYWHEHEGKELLIDQVSIIPTNKFLIKDSKNLDKTFLLNLDGFENRSSNFMIYFQPDYPFSSRYLAANDGRETFSNPSLFYNLGGIGEGESINFSAIICSRESINREIELVIWELEVTVRGETSIAKSNPTKTTVTDQWDLYNVSYTKQRADTILRCEIFWHDSNGIDIMVALPSISIDG
ncbi:hypothetical protein P2R64_32385 [Priestia megaterium]|uniref:hypothetical protein n=1 Tax=Priestia megaterium TaxID=1404 RepID=UPI0023DA087E|nr:hypothetical protein [Priestia megaterium]MDF1964702.1 hypothetical protein [Priestia megaterium]